MHDILTFGDYCSFECKNYEKTKLQVRSQIVDVDMLMDVYFCRLLSDAHVPMHEKSISPRYLVLAHFSN